MVLTELNIGGGHGVPYVAGDAELDLDKLAGVIDDVARPGLRRGALPRPKVVVEPGRAVSARAGVTCYRVVAVKQRPGGRTFVAVDGGMSDNPRVALYGACYTVTVANRHPPRTDATRHHRRQVLRGRRHHRPRRRDARPTCIPVTCWPWPAPGAYHHSMASTFNTVGRPPVVAVPTTGGARELVRRETTEDLLAQGHADDAR